MTKLSVNKQAAFFSLGLSTLLAASLYVVAVFFRGESFYALAWLPEGKLSCAVVLVVFGLFLSFCFYALLQHFPLYSNRRLQNTQGGFAKKIVFTKQGILSCSIIIFLFWLPVAVLMYPTAANQDFFNQIYQFQASAPTWYTSIGVEVDAEFIDHHPIFDTLFFGAFYILGDMLGSQNLGLFLLNLVLNAFLAVALGFSCCYLEKLGLPGAVRIGALLFAIFFPYNSLLAADATKDTLFSAFFVAFLLCYFEIFRTQGQILKNKPFVIAFFLLVGLCILTKKLGVYICVPSILILLIPFASFRKHLLALAASAFIVFSFLVPQVLYVTLDVAPGGRQETLAFALQQSVTLIRENPDALSEDDMKAIEKVLNVEVAVEKYNKTLSDQVKNRFRSDASTEDIIRYLGVWAKGGLQHPIIYTKSLLMCSARLLIPSSPMQFDVDITDEDHRTRWSKWFHNTSEGFDFKAERPVFLLNMANTMKDIVTVQMAGIPVLGLFGTKGMYGGWLPFICVAITLFCNRKNSYAFIPTILSVFTLVISPGSLSRYVVCFIFCVIPVVGWMLYSLKNSVRLENEPGATEENC